MAYHLAGRGAKEVVLLEQESQPGVHSSGRNAAMIRQVVGDPVVARIAWESAARIREMRTADGDAVPIRESGSLLIGRGEEWRRLSAVAEEGREEGMPIGLVGRDTVVEKVPILEGAVIDGAIWTESDGVLDVTVLLDAYLAGARSGGVSMLCDRRVTGIHRTNDGRVTIETDRGRLSAEVVVNAAGAWAEEVGRMAGATRPPLRPCRRHLFFTGPLDWVDPGWPFVWDVEARLYFRPETGGLLLSPCDEADHAPGMPATDPAAADALAEKIAAHVPRMPDVPIQRGWAGLRTLTGDGRFVIGWDPVNTHLFWLAGLGGHGVTCSYAVGEMAAEAILSEDRGGGGPHDPARFL